MGVFWGGKLGTAEAKSSMQASPAFSCKACSHRTSSLIPYCCSWGRGRGRRGRGGEGKRGGGEEGGEEEGGRGRGGEGKREGGEEGRGEMRTSMGS